MAIFATILYILGGINQYMFLYGIDRDEESNNGAELISVMLWPLFVIYIVIVNIKRNG